jgi:PAS domain S-box-containing protein
MKQDVTLNPLQVGMMLSARRRLGLALAGILLFGAWFTTWAIRREDRLMREELLQQTFTVARALPLDRIQTLTGSPADEQKPEYRRLKEQLMAAAQIDPAWQWIYLMGRNARGEVCFLVDSEDYDAPDPSPPGQLYEEASELLRQIFDRRLTATEGPLEDRWGTWVSAFVPLADPRTGRLVAVLGIDIEAGLWRTRAQRAGIVPALFTLTLIVIVLAGFAMRGRRTSIRAQVRRRWRKLEVSLSITAGIALTLTGVWLAHSVEILYQQESFHSLAYLKTDYILQAFRNLRNKEIESLGRFFESSEDVTPEEFRNYADYLSRVPEAQAWGWIPAETRAGAEPLPVCPLAYLHPDEARALFNDEFQHDLRTDPHVRSLLEETARTGLPVATDLQPAPDPADDSHRFLVFRPVFSGGSPPALRGFVMAVVDPGKLLKTVLGANLDHNPIIHLDLVQLRKDAALEPLASSRNTPVKSLLAPLRGRPGLTRPILAFGRTYAVTAHPTEEFMERHANYLGWVVLAAGLAITLAIAVVLAFLAHRREDMERLVEERTFDLAATMRRYDLLAGQNHVIVWQVDAAGFYTEVNAESEAITGYAPEKLIGKVRFFDLHPAPGREDIREFFLENLARGEAFTDLSHAVVTKSGETRWFWTSGIPVRDPAGRVSGYWGTSTDITERKHAEDELARLAAENKKAAERYATLISASNTGAWEYDDETARVWVSPEYHTMLGRSPAEVDSAAAAPDIEQIWMDWMHPDDRQAAQRAFADYLKNPEGMYQRTFRMRHADGQWVWILSRGRVLRDAQGRKTSIVVGTHIDISESKKTEEELRESRRQYAALAGESAGHGLPLRQ